MAVLSYHLTLLLHFSTSFWLASLLCLCLCGATFLWIKRPFDHVALAMGLYLSLAGYLLGALIVALLAPDPITWLRLYTLGYALCSLAGFGRIARTLIHWWRTHPYSAALLAVICVAFAYFLTAFTYENGLHDEYYHHAIINQFFLRNQFPFIEPYRLESQLTGYHYGLYFVVIGIKSFLNLSVESALDLAKIVLFLPAIPALALLTARVFRLSRMSAIVLTSSGFLLGPSLFLLDSFSDNVIRGARLPQIFTPLLFEYAGLTWHGCTFFLVFLLGAYAIARRPTPLPQIATLGFVGLSLSSLVLINQVFFLLALPCLALIGAARVRRDWHRFPIRSSLIALTFALTAGGSLYWMSADRSRADARTTQTSNVRLHAGEVPLAPGLRPRGRIGLPYLDERKPLDAVSRLSYATITDAFFWKAVGLLWIATLVFTLPTFKKALHTEAVGVLLVLGLLVGAPLLVYAVSVPTDDLALNKFLRPAVFILPYLLFLSTRDRSVFVRAIVIVLLFFGMVAPTYFFVTSRFSAVQQPWIVRAPADRDLLWYLDHQTSGPQQIVTNSSSVQELLANTRLAQVEICYTECGSTSRIDLIIADAQRPMAVAAERRLVFANQSYQIYR